MSAVGERNDLGLAPQERYRILTQYRTIAMVGLSANYYNASSFAAIYLDANGYDIVPVNPAQAGKRTILNRPVYADLAAAAVAHPRPIEIVDVFRPAGEAPAIARQAVKIGAKVLWLQLGVISEEAAHIAHDGDDRPPLRFRAPVRRPAGSRSPEQHGNCSPSRLLLPAHE
jgi:predicted CoA-binding protein